MKRAVYLIPGLVPAGVLAAALGLGALATNAYGTRGAPPAPSPPLAQDAGVMPDGLPAQTLATLTPIDTVPTPAEIDSQFRDHATALENLILLTTENNDIGVRIRAIHALPAYCASPCTDGDPAHQALVNLIAASVAPSVPQTGPVIVMLRTAIEALGPMKIADDVGVLVPLLAHSSRDIRAATAHALRDLGNTQACQPLRDQQANEWTAQVLQVYYAISDALRSIPCQESL